MKGRSLHFLLLTGILATLLAGCASGGSSPSPSAAPPTATAAASAIPTTATSWGTILDALPASFPQYPNAQTADANVGAVSAALNTADSVSSVSAWYGNELDKSGYKIASTSGPFEDGSMVTEFDGAGLAPGCKAQVTVRPQGGLTLITILVGANCPAS